MKYFISQLLKFLSGPDRETRQNSHSCKWENHLRLRLVGVRNDGNQPERDGSFYSVWLHKCQEVHGSSNLCAAFILWSKFRSNFSAVHQHEVLTAAAWLFLAVSASIRPQQDLSNLVLPPLMQLMNSDGSPGPTVASGQLRWRWFQMSNHEIKTKRMRLLQLAC